MTEKEIKIKQHPTNDSSLLKIIIPKDAEAKSIPKKNKSLNKKKYFICYFFRKVPIFNQFNNHIPN